MSPNPYAVTQRHPLCTGAGCESCKRIDDELAQRISDMRERVDALDEPDRLRLLESIVQHNPDAIADALVETGAWVPERQEWDS